MVGMGYNSAGYLSDIEIIDLVRLIYWRKHIQKYSKYKEHN